MSNLPEGMILVCNPNDRELIVIDAQGIEWLSIFKGGNGDPTSWQISVARHVCLSLGVVECSWPDDEVLSVEDTFARLSNEWEGFNP